MNNRILRITGILCLFMFLFSCHDDEPHAVGPEKDNYLGNHQSISLTSGMERFRSASFKLALSTDDGTVITRTGTHKRINGKSILNLDSGLKSGEYRLLYLLSPTVDAETGDTIWEEYGLGCRVRIDENGITDDMLDKYSELMELFGEGTSENPFIVSSSSHLKRIRDVANDHVLNNLLLFPKTHFLQTAHIDLEQASWNSDKNYGWMPIGDLNNNPFRGIYNGNGFEIYGMWIKRPDSGGLGLFGYAENATFRNINMVNPTIDGNFAAGSILGAVVTQGNKRTQTNIVNCTTMGGRISAKSGSAAIGGLVGLADMESKVMIEGCSNMGTAVYGSYGVGGIIGAGSIFSNTTLQTCQNLADIKAEYTGCGGIVGSCDTLMIMSCSNEGTISGALSYSPSDTNNSGIGAGGIAGGTGMAFVYTCTNNGIISGHTGVGGIIGSTCVSREYGYFNNAMFRSCSNHGSIIGETSVGGICGEAQFGCYGVYNKGDVTGNAENCIVGGIAGNTSVAVIHNSLNAGKVTANKADCVGGVVGKSTWGTIFTTQNFGEVNTTANYVGGIVALAGTQSVLNYCCNAGNITNSGNGITGGLVGEMGDPREWTTMNTINCIIGGIECVLGIAGPVIACTGESLKEGGELAKKVTDVKKWERIHKVAHCIEIAFDISTIVYDWVGKALCIPEWVNPEEIDALKAQITEEAKKIDAGVKADIDNMRSTLMVPKKLYSGLDASTAAQYYAGLNALVAFHEASPDNSNTLNYSLNYERKLRSEEVESQKKVYEIVHGVIGGACLVVSTAAFIAGLAVSGGTAIVVAFVGGVATFTGGVNAIAENCDDYQPNVVSITQCVNMGNVSANNSDNPGGIVGHLQQFCMISDCLNMGEYTGSKLNGAGIAGEIDAECELFRCLNVGDKWMWPIYSNSVISCSIYDNYYFESTSPGVDSFFDQGHYYSLEKLCKKSSYDDLDFSSSYALWKVEERSGCFPVPNHSKMEIDNEPKE